MEIFDIFNTSRFMPRAHCGNWTQSLIYFHNVSDFFIWSAYLAIPLVLLSFTFKRRDELPFRHLFWLFGLFIVACGTTHLMDIVLFYYPIYTFSGWVKLLTAAASWGTVMAMFHVAPRALQMRSPEKLEHEVQMRTTELREVNERLAEANRAKDEHLRREQQARQVAEEANRAKDAFLATVSHELRTPLTSMLGWSALLRDGHADHDTLRKAMDAIERNAKAQSQIIDDLLDVSRIVTGKLRIDTRPLDVAPLVEAALDAVRPAAQAKNIVLETDLALMNEAGVANKVNGDAARLQQIVWNLASNAVKFTPKGGHVWVNLRRDESHVIIVVRDNGQGIDPDFLPHVFERFRQADDSSTRSIGGLGLGLAIVRHLVEMHGGIVQAQSAGLGEGATFTVRLPVLAVDASITESPLAPDAVEAAHVTLPPAILQGLRLLIVEDDADARQMITTVLQHFGAEVRGAGSAPEGFDLLRDAQPDVLVSDIGLPGEDGYALMERVRALSPQEGGRIPAAALTAFAGAPDRMRALAAGFQVHLAKPVEPSELVVTVASLAGRSINRVRSEE